MELNRSRYRAQAFSFTWVLALILGGIFALVVLELVARGLAPAAITDGEIIPVGLSEVFANPLGRELVGEKVEFDALIAATAQTAAGVDLGGDAIFSAPILGETYAFDGAMLVHFAAGIVLFPFLYMLLLRPIFFFLPWFILGPIAGAGLWLLWSWLTAQYGTAGIAEATPEPFLSFSPLAIGALASTLLYGLTLGLFARMIAGR